MWPVGALKSLTASGKGSCILISDSLAHVRRSVLVSAMGPVLRALVKINGPNKA